eukprot:TRINITY_DN12415_c3_g1_i5.p1 TRINITY_DN12415_c3_g1~~TRINITY_DN12415_c3_g1_i5.p1  ORF type:complete len:292 (+),score=36.55 TRINITY_DN12415_c3_g1_i5:129-1004(+)
MTGQSLDRMPCHCYCFFLFDELTGALRYDLLNALIPYKERINNINFEVNSGNWSSSIGTLTSRYQLTIAIASTTADAAVHLDLLSNANHTEYTRITLTEHDIQACTNTTMTENVDHAGDDLQEIPLSGANATAEHCLQLCCQTNSCEGFVFAHPQPHTSQDICWLKSAITASHSLPNVTSGIIGLGTAQLALDTTRASSLPSVPGRVVTANITGSRGGYRTNLHAGWSLTINLDIVVDNSVIEVFAADGSVAMTTNVHPQTQDLSFIHVEAKNARVQVTGTQTALSMQQRR